MKPKNKSDYRKDEIKSLKQDIKNWLEACEDIDTFRMIDNGSTLILTAHADESTFQTSYWRLDDFVSLIISWLYLQYNFHLDFVYQNLGPLQGGLRQVEQTIYVFKGA